MTTTHGMIPAPTERVRRMAEDAWHDGGDTDDVYAAVRAAGYAHRTAAGAAEWALEWLGGGL